MSYNAVAVLQLTGDRAGRWRINEQLELAPDVWDSSRRTRNRNM